MTKSFVAGATGYTGRSVVAVMRERGHRVVAHVRPDSSSLERWRARFADQGATVETAAWEPTAMVDALREHEPDVVFALLGTTRKRADADGMGANEAYERVDYGLTKMLLDACVEAVPEARFVYLSSAGVQPDTTNPYLAARAKVEAALRDGSQPYVIARPSFISGDRDESRPGERIGATMADAALTVLGWFGGRRVRDRYQSMTGRELAEGLVRAAVNPDAAGEILHAERLRARTQASTT